MDLAERRLVACKACEFFDGCCRKLHPEWQTDGRFQSFISKRSNSCPDESTVTSSARQSARWGTPTERIVRRVNAPFRAWTGTEWVAVDLWRNDLGAKALFCCPGPSLRDIAGRHELHVPGVVVFGVNTAYPTIRPDIWVGVDKPDCYHPDIWNEAFRKCWNWEHRNEFFSGRRIRGMPNVQFFTLESRWAPEDLAVPEIHAGQWGKGGFWTGLRVAHWMGARDIYLIGCDFGGKTDYCHDLVLLKKRREHNRALYGAIVERLKVLAPKLRERGVSLTSCTRGSPVNDFLPFRELAQVLAEAKAEAGARQPAIIHGTDIPACRWRGSSRIPVGVMTGADSNHEDLLPWWWHHYRKRCAAPVVFADFGMSKQMADWCQQRGTRIKIQSGIEGKAWWNKPFALLRTPFRKTVWIDVDCRVCADPQAILDRDGFCATRDDWATKQAIDKGWAAQGETVYSSGVLMVPYGHPLVSAWAKGCLAWHHKERMIGDQDAMSVAASDRDDEINVLKPTMNAHRQWRGAQPGDMIAHYSGPRGRQAARAEAASNPEILLQIVRRHPMVISRAGGAASHLPLLALALSLADGSVLELGCGLYSTPFLHRACRIGDRQLYTVDTDAGWLNRVREYTSNAHHMIHAPDLPACDLLQKDWAVAFVDHADAPSRGTTADLLRGRAKLVICHDTQSPVDRYEPAFAKYKYRLDDKRFRAWSTLVSDTVDLSGLILPPWESQQSPP